MYWSRGQPPGTGVHASHCVLVLPAPLHRALMNQPGRHVEGSVHGAQYCRRTWS